MAVMRNIFGIVTPLGIDRARPRYSYMDLVLLQPIRSLGRITTTKGIGGPLRFNRIMCRGAYPFCCKS
nr:unnamed protein product [Callosobruchus analis]